MKKVIVLILLMGLSLSMFGKKVTGTVTDIQGNPLLGVVVMIEGTLIGVQTDVDGRYQIYCEPNDVLVFDMLSLGLSASSPERQAHAISGAKLAQFL